MSLPAPLPPPCQGSSKQGISTSLLALNQSAFDRFQKGDVGDKAGNLLYEPQFECGFDVSFAKVFTILKDFFVNTLTSDLDFLNPLAPCPSS